jgi:hypothetical protein
MDLSSEIPKIDDNASTMEIPNPLCSKGPSLNVRFFLSSMFAASGRQRHLPYSIEKAVDYSRCIKE